jgi:hypothetical protein
MHAPSRAVLLHGGTMARRATLARAIRAATGLGTVRVRVSSRAAEAAKCLADPGMVAVFLLDAPTDGDAVRGAALGSVLGRHCYDVEPRDDGDVVVRLVRTAVDARERATD